MCTISWKKSLDLNKTSPVFFAFFGTIWWLIFSFIFIFFGFFNIELIFNPIFIYLIIINIACVIATNIEQAIYKTEKLSVLAPYTNLDTIIITLISYLIFLKFSILSFQTSFFSFIIALIAGIIITVSSIDFKNFWLPKDIRLLLFSRLLRIIKNMFTGYFLVQISSIDFFVLNNASYVILSFIILIYKKELNQFNKITIKFFLYRMFSSLIGCVSYIIWLFLIKNLGLIISNLLWFFSLFTTLVISYFFLKDIPTKKNIIVTILISICIILWVIFK
jgi:hypothetical protein